ncbi:AAA-ATPase [Phocaeicola salanitronis DSM 18170]|uniref:AAA-ATPase n=1 Tax=Phocaeicola salanitronis (strain DSM 18170 / JCM 13657 / CCUG 60908 / BL78) TaxID=667015 RepID=F0R167_PHOSB|nr:ATP-binding protein [Phocaeicola salanitronis]ADY36295.1 AAA-ATPase [Phocaeicola salanitronis DSM 18170]
MLYPIGIQSFADIRERGFVYVDKTAMVYQMALRGKFYFLSRPRRFGKSLLVSTMEAYFLGKKELFKGLAIEKLETDWVQYPILHLDLNAQNYTNENALQEELDKHLMIWEQAYGLTTDKSLSPETRFYNVIHNVYKQTGKQVVVLIDEYDKPLLNTIDNETLHSVYRNMLKAFFSVLKSLDACIRFGFITGVSKFSHVSIFSDLNNLKDISMDPRYVDICGISEQELHGYFDDSIRELADANGITFEEACGQLRKQYDGYHFREDSIGVYNPFSLLNTFDSQVFNDYWFETGTPTFLVKLLQSKNYRLKDLEGKKVMSDVLSTTDTATSNPIPVLYQSGYLTIKGYDRKMRIYTLGFPNEEVERGFFNFLLPYYTPISNDDKASFLSDFVVAVDEGRPEDFLLLIQTMLAGQDYRIAGDAEKYFQNTFYLIFQLLGFNVVVEQATSQGRMDVTIQTDGYIYIIELKLDKTAEEALRQIKDNQYARPFQADKRKLYLIGVNFSSETRTVEKWVVEECSCCIKKQ